MCCVSVQITNTCLFSFSGSLLVIHSVFCNSLLVIHLVFAFCVGDTFCSFAVSVNQVFQYPCFTECTLIKSRCAVMSSNYIATFSAAPKIVLVILDQVFACWFCRLDPASPQLFPVRCCQIGKCPDASRNEALELTET